METLLVRSPSLLDEVDKRNLLDREYCKNVLRLQIGNLPLLRRVRDGRNISGHDRYYTAEYGEFHICNNWWKDHHDANARSLLRFVVRLAERKAGNPDTARLERHIAAFRDYLG